MITRCGYNLISSVQERDPVNLCIALLFLLWETVLRIHTYTWKPFLHSRSVPTICEILAHALTLFLRPIGKQLIWHFLCVCEIHLFVCTKSLASEMLLFLPQVVGYAFDQVDDCVQNPYHETVYSLLDSVSPAYREAFGNALLQRLEALKRDGQSWLNLQSKMGFAKELLLISVRNRLSWDLVMKGVISLTYSLLSNFFASRLALTATCTVYHAGLSWSRGKVLIWKVPELYVVLVFLWNINSLLNFNNPKIDILKKWNLKL